MLSDLQKAQQLQRFIVRPALNALGAKYGGLNAERLVVGTALTESHGESFDQITGIYDDQLGPAYGLWQIEPWVFQDLKKTFLAYRPNIANKLLKLKANAPDESTQLATNLCLGAAVCRLLYYRQPEPMPTTLEGMDKFWKEKYNTIKGKGKIGDFANKAKVVMLLNHN